jgi:4'-phosphopantetheinyl transferase
LIEGSSGEEIAADGPEPGTVDVWSASLEPPASVAPLLRGYLSPDELERAERFVFARDRDRFVAGRAFLRLLLAQSLGESPAGLLFRYGPNGKPALAEARCDMEFNLAHSDTLVVCALARGCEGLGVDVERVRPIGDATGVARLAFSPREVSRLESLPGPVRLRAFYEAWTRKEAFLKALGCGLGRPLDSFDVSFGPDEPPRLLLTLEDPTEAERYSLHALEPEPGHVCAVAVAGHGWRLRHRRWRWPGASPTS